jgi:tRNA(His) 5'-end guanylyltransferase
MASDKTAIGDRMKRYEAATSMVLPRRTYTIIRVDGRAFHTLLRKAAKPYDWYFNDTMDKVTVELCKGIENAVAAYVQSDEISVILTDFKTHATEPWFGGVVQKMCSISASLATYHFNVNGYGGMGLFDSRVYTIPSKTDVMNYLVWRQKDNTRNSVNMLARHHFSVRELHGKSTLQRLDMLADKGVSWESEPDRFKRGGLCEKHTYEVQAHPSAPSTATTRTKFVVNGAPIFDARPGSYLDELIPTME